MFAQKCDRFKSRLTDLGSYIGHCGVDYFQLDVSGLFHFRTESDTHKSVLL
jgi:hypothetical protein